MIYDLLFSVLASWKSIGLYFFIAIAIISLWIPKIKNLWILFYLLALAFGYFAGRVSETGLILIFLLGLCCYIFSREPDLSAFKTISFFFIFIFGIAANLHLIPGFYNWKMLSNVHISEEGIPFSLYLNLEKITLGIFILVSQISLCEFTEMWKRAIRYGVGISLMATGVLMLLAYGLDYVQWDPKLSLYIFLWAPTNLLFVCVSEEAFFRGFLQTNIRQALPSLPMREDIGVIIAAILFGFVHFPGGLSYIFLATIAGIFYGTAYLVSRRIEASILVHFTVNLTHFLLFTYPAL